MIRLFDWLAAGLWAQLFYDQLRIKPQPRSRSLSEFDRAKSLCMLVDKPARHAE